MYRPHGEYDSMRADGVKWDYITFKRRINMFSLIFHLEKLYL